ncbi:protein cortex-like [Neodiprion fabricii]|uniref:protein cortex-like n=1 Tax=Neodiprion fabricii TaxID=2872261 RepID=UPI001ED94C3C|nr:protein cortex-like [Neodiprion fabricii]
MINARAVVKFEEEENLSIYSQSMMLPAAFAREDRRDVFVDGDSTSTPLRAGIVRLPRLRLLDKHFKLESTPVYASREDKPNPVRSFAHRHKYDGRTVPPTRFYVDRFIPRRRGHNLEVAHHALVYELPKKTSGRILDLPNDLNCMGLAWQKRSMARALETIIPGAGRQRLLQLSQRTSAPRTVPGTLAGRPRNFDETNDSLDEYKWPVRPRRCPVIGKPYTMLDIPHFRPSLRKSLLDWSSMNMLAAAVDHGVYVMSGNFELNADDSKFLFHDTCTAVKFSNSGRKIAIGRSSSLTSVYRIGSNKFCCEFKCAATNHSFSCQPQCYAWSNDDRYLVIGCSGGYLEVINVPAGVKKNIVEASVSDIVTVSFSPKDRYVACGGREAAVRIFTWPDLTPFMEIGYLSPVRAMAWHPWESSILCIGGGQGDGSLSIWNIQRQMSLGYRAIKFDGCVDTVLWNKVTGEMAVNWFVRDHADPDNYYAAMPVYASFDNVTDAIIPSLKKTRIPYAAWNPDGTQIACQARDSVFIHGFLDNKEKRRLEERKRLPRSRVLNSELLSAHSMRYKRQTENAIVYGIFNTTTSRRLTVVSIVSPTIALRQRAVGRHGTGTEHSVRELRS